MLVIVEAQDAWHDTKLRNPESTSSEPLRFRSLNDCQYIVVPVKGPWKIVFNIGD